MPDTQTIDLPATGVAMPAIMGETLMWYDGPVLFEVTQDRVDAYMVAMAVPDRPGWKNCYVAFALSAEVKALALERKVDIRTIMSRPDAPVWRVDYVGPGDELSITPILEPLPDDFMPDWGVYLDTLASNEEDESTA